MMYLPRRLTFLGNLFFALILAATARLPAADLVHRYSFTSDAHDSISTAHGTLLGGATIVSGAVSFNGSSAYVDLPNGLVSTLTNATFAVWLTDNNSGTWARIIDFGNSTGGEGSAGQGTQYLFLSPQSGSGNLRGAITDGSGEQSVNSPSRLPAGSLKHVAWTIDSATQTSRLYVDGSLVAENTAMTINPASLGNTLNNWLGRSQFSGDSYFNGTITEFRIYDGALTLNQIQTSYTDGPEVFMFDGPAAITTQPQSQSVAELAPVTFDVGYRASPPLGLQWRRNGVNIPGATNRIFTLAGAALANNGAAFSVVLTNSYLGTNYTAISSNAVLTVVADTNPPVLVRAASLFPGEVLVTFSEGLREDTATNTANYVITRTGGSLAVMGARFGNTSSSIILTTAAQSPGTNYTLTVNGVRDLALAANRIATNSQADFVATLFVTTDIGNPASAGTFTVVFNGLDVTASGSGIGGTSDQFTFCSQSFTNNFDVQVRVAGLSFVSAWTRAALMARDGVETNAVFAASAATPGPAGCHFESRTSVGGSATMAGTFPVNYPDTWLRLRRTGNVFDGFASLDGSSWEYLGSSSIAMSNTVQVGFALTAGNATGSTTAQFRDFANASGTITTNVALPFEPPGPSSRRTALVISEIMYDTPGAWGGTNSLEFVELWNSGLITEDLTGHKLTGEISYRFPDGTRIAPGQFLVVAKVPAAVQSFYGVTCLGPYENKLANGGGTLRLLNELGGRLLEIEYDNKTPWPVAANGTGHSLVLSHPSFGENDPRAWSASDVIGGSPGRFEHWGIEPARNVVINEVLAHTDLPMVDAVELFNAGASAVNLSGAWLSDEAGTNKFRIPNGTVIPARGFLAYDSTQLGFALAAEGEPLYLVNSNLTRVLDAVNFPGQANGVSSGRYPSGAPNWQELSTRTFGTANTAPLTRTLVINEIMYNPISGLNDDEYIEIYNRGTTATNIGGWKLQGGASFTFPRNTILNAGAYFVVAENLTNLLARYPQLNSTNTFGNYNGSLKDGGERIALGMPEDLITTNSYGVVVTNFYYIAVDEVTYLDGGRWGQWSDGGGSSLELTDAHSDNRLAANWADSDESAKAAWTTIAVTNVMENGQTGNVNEGNDIYGAANRFEVFLQGPGEALLDSLEFHSNTGGNLLANGTFDSDTTGWTLGGVLRGSYAQAGAGIGGSQALHLVSTDRGDNGPNKVFAALTATAATGNPNTGTIRASARWLRGSPYILLRTRGNWMEVSQRLNVPANCGTPGAANSRLVANAGPAITGVSHSPVLPAANQSVVVSARAIDPDGLGAVTLKYRLDPATSYTSVAMLDNGTGGDAIAGDGLYSATIPGQSSDVLAAFYMTATDGTAAASQFPAAAPVRECHVRWGESLIAGSIGNYRLWVTDANIAFWGNREKNANDPIDATFVYGNSRVVYNVNTLYSGSPFHAPSYDGPLGSMACDYEVNFPADEHLLGSKPFVLTAFDTASGNFFFNDDSAQVDLTGNWVARKLGQPYNYRRHVHVVVNGLRRGTIYDDAQQPNSEVVAEFFPDDQNGQLRKIEGWFEFADNGLDQANTFATLDRVNKSTGDIDAKRYRGNWRPRATDNPDDWGPFLGLVAAVNNTNAPDYLNLVRTWMDVPNFLRPIITHHVCGSWDSYAYERGKNMFAYKPDNQPWRLLMWDIELSLGAGGSSATDSIYNMFDKPLLRLIINNPAIHREYLRGFQEALDTALMPGAADPQLDERYAAFQQHNLPLVSPQFIKSYIASRRSYLLTVIPTSAFAVSNPAYQVVTGTNTITLTGTGPLAVENILVNSNAYAVTWTGVINWSVTVPLAGGTNLLNVTATDRKGGVITNATGSVTVNYTDGTVAPEGWIVFNEIMYHPAVAGAEFVELFNAHTNYTFDLSGWSINGLDYTFPSGATMGPRSYLVLAGDRFVYSETYGLTKVAFDQFKGSFDADGETLTLYRPNGGSTNLLAVNRVRYEAAAPWPVLTRTASLQLIDAAQDNRRVANWAVGGSNSTVVLPPAYLALLDYTNVWKFMQVSNLNAVNWTATSYNHSSWPSGPGLLAFESNQLITNLIHTVLNSPRTATNGMTAGHGYYFRTTLNLAGSLDGYRLDVSTYVDDGAVFYINGSEIKRIRMSDGTVVNATLASDAPPNSKDATTPDTFTIPASAFVAGANVIAVEVHQDATTSSDVVFGFKLEATYTNTAAAPAAPALATPGSANSIATNLAAFPSVWLNELQANNVTGPRDNFSQRDPWAEIFNPATTNFSLAGYYLTDTYTNLTKWAFPASAVVSSNGFTLVWCDNQTNQNTATNIHAAFALASDSGSVALTRVIGNTVQIVDYLNYAGLPANWSYGDYPDGQPCYRKNLFFVTPAATNNGASAPITIFINEWMADNTRTLMDPADNDYEDWFELYNPGTNAVDLGGYYLTDNLTNKSQFKIPDNGHYLVPAGGYLLVWADSEASQNSTNRADIHANFALSKGGEAIGLFAADGTTIDAVTFGAQTSDISQGRFPNGAANIYSMSTPTPRAANVVPNTAPVLASLTNRVVTLGQTLSFTANATDTDQPLQILTFSLSNAPVGAQIGATSGLFTWTPASAPSTKTLGVIVTDNGTPVLSATRSFTVVVAPVPVSTGCWMDGDVFVFSWSAVAGQRIQVEFKDDLRQNQWMPFGNPLTATGSRLEFSSELDESTQRFFRLRVLP